MSYLQRPDSEPENLRELAENLSNTFSDNFKRNKPNSTLNASRYLSRKCFESSDLFRDKLGNFDANKFTFCNFGNELTSKDDTNNNNNSNNTGIKRTGMDLDGPTNKKRRIDNENNINDDKIENDSYDSDNDSDIKMSDDEMNINNNKKKQKKRKLNLPERFKKDEDFQSLQPPPINPSKADEFFDPINYCSINLEEESRLNVNTKEYLNKYELFNQTDIEINGNEIKYINKTELNKYLINSANKSGYTMQKDIAILLCLGLKDHLKNMLDDMNKWRKLRANNMNSKYSIRYDALDKQEWMDDINEKYSVKQQISEAKDEIEALETEKTDLDFKKVTGILTDEETKRRTKLDQLIRTAKQKQKKNDETKANEFSLAALGGNFSFNFRGNNNEKNRNKTKNKRNERRLQSDKFYVIDAINMIENHQKYNQQHLKQLSKLYLKAI